MATEGILPDLAPISNQLRVTKVLYRYMYPRLYSLQGLTDPILPEPVRRPGQLFEFIADYLHYYATAILGRVAKCRPHLPQEPSQLSTGRAAPLDVWQSCTRPSLWITAPLWKAWTAETA
jgi:hypothetical protein